MPRVVAKTKLVAKERGGRAQVAFREAIGLRENEDFQFQKMKYQIRVLAIKHFEIGLKPREQGKHRYERFFQDVHKAYPIFRRDTNGAKAHLVTYIDRFLQAKSVPSSRFHVSEEDYKPLDNGSEYTLDHMPRVNMPRYDAQMRAREEHDGYAYVDRRPSPTVSGGYSRSFSPDSYVVMSQAEQQTTSHEGRHLYNPSRAGSTSQRSLTSRELVDASSVKEFLSRAKLEHLHEELLKVGVNNVARLHAVAIWPEHDIDELFRGSLRESRIDRFEAQQLNVAFRSLRRSLMSVDGHDTYDLD